MIGEICALLATDKVWLLLTELEKQPLRFKEITKRIIKSESSANRLLGRLQERKIIKKTVRGYGKSQHVAYDLTKDGHKLLNFFRNEFQPLDWSINTPRSP